ncbi:BTB/POZ domain-containing protein 1-like isoform X3 [Entelurus aequoreus]|uniref:BTB/POZ domain-containing protein 1-like isoform X3 n=1 Tax=Entelurus aequoreus TaxID=161455 RepID=UPI002B1DFA13|nr:BTB/POZ domain-containing protein 1-like isoform X3 [Entelurus aequoreus]
MATGGGLASNHDAQEPPSNSALSGAAVALSSVPNSPPVPPGPREPVPPVPPGPREPGPPVPPGPREPVYNWQATKSSLKERFAYLFNNQLLSDVSFVVGKGRQAQRIPAHKFVLAAGSAVFEAMFNGAMATTSTEIEVPDAEPAAFLSLLRFLYSDDVHTCAETVMSTLNTAKKYAVPALASHCVDFVSKHLRADNAFLLLTQARLYDEPQISSLCFDTIDKSTAEAVNADAFTDIDLDTLCAVLERDSLSIRENRLFGAVVRWAEAECCRQQLPPTPDNKQKVLGKALPLIRFPLMSVEKIPAGLSSLEVKVLFPVAVNPKARGSCSDRARCCLRGEECSIKRFQQVESRWGYSGTSDRIRFNVSRRISIVGFGLYGSIHGHTDYQVNIQILESDKHLTLGQKDTAFSCDGTSNTFRVLFTEPVEVLPNVSYTACATLKGPDSSQVCSAPSGTRLTLRHQGPKESQPGVGSRDQDHLCLLQVPREQQRYFSGGRPDTGDHLLQTGLKYRHKASGGCSHLQAAVSFDSCSLHCTVLLNVCVTLLCLLETHSN